MCLLFHAPFPPFTGLDAKKKKVSSRFFSLSSILLRFYHYILLAAFHFLLLPIFLSVSLMLIKTHPISISFVRCYRNSMVSAPTFCLRVCALGLRVEVWVWSLHYVHEYFYTYFYILCILIGKSKRPKATGKKSNYNNNNNHSKIPYNSYVRQAVPY